MQKIVRPTVLEAALLPPTVEPCFDLMAKAGQGAPFALFGGALRDVRYGHMHGRPHRINDYDLRMVTPEEEVEGVVRRLGKITGKVVQVVPSAGTGLPLYRLNYHGADLDISFRTSLPTLGSDVSVVAAQASGFSGSACIAQERAANAVIGISGIALDQDGIAWEVPEQVTDCKNRTLSVYPRSIFPYPTAARVHEYVDRMQAKFSDHTVQHLVE